MAVKTGMRVLGFMTGTSLDAVDMAVLETDGEEITGLGPVGEKKLDPAARALLEAAIADALKLKAGDPTPASFGPAAAAVAAEHIAAGEAFIRDNAIFPGDLDLVGLQGQTVLHAPPGPDRPAGRTIQLIDADAVAQALGVPTVYDLRSDDVAAGGQGAPLAPVYHAALVRYSGLHTPTAVLNLGGVANLTLVRSDGALEAFDTGPANGMIDLLVQDRTDRRFDEGGALARAGQAHERVLTAYLNDPYFKIRGPKSLDRFDFSLGRVAPLSLEDAAATLVAFAAETVVRGLKTCSEIPLRLVVTGGGRHNPALMDAIKQRAPLPVLTAEDVNWRGDSIEAEAFAFLGARSMLGLPISFPGTTGVPEPMTGGRIAMP
ncbi:MAG TPA: anhydro-N-acetylmuramic acid kinase [Caulobacteraceae bacterium]|nr:anhydro-N-acetylmuramic acid kinase [Caulobacteraceae bacterium]